MSSMDINEVNKKANATSLHPLDDRLNKILFTFGAANSCSSSQFPLIGVKPPFLLLLQVTRLLYNPLIVFDRKAIGLWLCVTIKEKLTVQPSWAGLKQLIKENKLVFKKYKREWDRVGL